MSGTPSRGHGDGGGEQRLLDRVLGRVEAVVAAREHAEDLRREAAQQVLDVRLEPHISVPEGVMSGRSSTYA